MRKTKSLCNSTGYVTPPFSMYLLYLRVLTVQELQRPGQGIVAFSPIHQDTDGPLKALTSSGKTLTKSERRVMSKIST